MIEFAGVKYYDIDEVSGILKVRKQTVYGYIWQGRMETYRIGRRSYVDERELEAFITCGYKASGHKGIKRRKEVPMR